MSGNVVNLHKGQSTPGEPVESVVEFLEATLARAKAGDVHCIVGAFDAHHGGCEFFVVGKDFGFDALGGVELAKQSLLRKYGWRDEEA